MNLFFNQENIIVFFLHIANILIIVKNYQKMLKE